MIEVIGSAGPGVDDILTPEALAFLADLQATFDLDARRSSRPGATARRRSTRVATRLRPGDGRHPRRPTGPSRPRPRDLDDRRVEITGPAEPKMMINALNSGARVFMADLEDALSPDVGERDRRPGRAAGRRPRPARIHEPRGQGVPAQRAAGPARGPAARLAPRGAPPARRRRAVSARRSSTSACTSSTTAPSACGAGAAPYFYLPEAPVGRRGGALGRRLRARLEERLGIPDGSIRTTVLIETIHAAFADGRDPPRARAVRGGPQRRPLGLPVQLHQDVPRSARTGSCRIGPS